MLNIDIRSCGRGSVLALLMLLLACSPPQKPDTGLEMPVENRVGDPGGPADVFLVVLGNAQDAGAPQVGCKRECCSGRWENGVHLPVSSLGLVDVVQKARYVFDATPDFPAQVDRLGKAGDFKSKQLVDGIFLTHAHMGHYTGLMYLGREAMGATGIPVYAMPGMRTYLQENGPWSQLVSLGNIELRGLEAEKAVELRADLRVTPIAVPHRDEFSETVGYRIAGPNKAALFIPDIDKWEVWERDIVEEVRRVDYAFLDATFYDATELPGRDMAEIPHPFVVESLTQFSDLRKEERGKVVFIHFNHTNPLADRRSVASQEVEAAGFGIARVGERYGL